MRMFNLALRRDIYDRFAITLRECQPSEGSTVLDVGCGSGPYAVALAKMGSEVVGIDLSSRMIDLARARAEREGVADRCELRVGDVMDLRPDRKFSYVIAMGVFDYVADPTATLGHLSRFAERKLLASFPKKWFPRSQWRKFRYGRSNCPVYFYTEHDVRGLGQALKARKVEVWPIPGPGYDIILAVEF